MVLAGGIKRVARSAGESEPLEADSLFAQRIQIRGFDLEPALQMLERKLEAFGFSQRLPSLEPCCSPERGDWRFFSQHQQVPDAPCPAGKFQATLPSIMLFPEFTDVADA